MIEKSCPAGGRRKPEKQCNSTKPDTHRETPSLKALKRSKNIAVLNERAGAVARNATNLRF